MSGSKPGERRGGRKPGVRNKSTEERLAAIQASGETPLEYMLRVLRDPTADISRRDDMAKAAGPYVHPRLASTESRVTVSKDSATDWTREELERFLDDAQTRGDGAAAPTELAGEPDKLH